MEEKRASATIRLREYREDRFLTQFEAVAAIQAYARARGDAVVPGLDQTALCKHENGQRRPSLYYQALYCEFYGASAVALGFRLARPGETRHDEDVDRREFIAGAAGVLASAALPSAPTSRLGHTDLVGLAQSVIHLDKLADQHGGAGAVYPLAVRLFRRLRGLVERASYDAGTGRAMRELVGQAAVHAGRMAFDAQRHDDARHWWLEATQWARLADADSLGAMVMATMARQASDQHRPRETIVLATAGQRIARRAATPRLTSVLLAREALGHAGAGDATNARTALRHARKHADTRHDDDPSWLDFYGPAGFASHECDVALMLGDNAAAEDAARAALALNDPLAYPRNHTLYTIWLADVLVQRREIDEGAAVAKRAAVASADLDSGRVMRGLEAVAQRLAPFKDDPSVGNRLDALYAVLPASIPVQ